MLLFWHSLSYEVFSSSHFIKYFEWCGFSTDKIQALSIIVIVPTKESLHGSQLELGIHDKAVVKLWLDCGILSVHNIKFDRSLVL